MRRANGVSLGGAERGLDFGAEREPLSRADDVSERMANNLTIKGAVRGTERAAEFGANFSPVRGADRGAERAAVGRSDREAFDVADRIAFEPNGSPDRGGIANFGTERGTLAITVRGSFPGTEHRANAGTVG